MLTFKEMHLTVYRTNKYGGMVVINARDPVAGEEKGGINYLSFFFTQREFCDLLEGRTSSVNDIGHNVRRSGEQYTFFDLDYPSGARGIMRVPYVNVQIPNYVARLLVRLVRAKLKTCPAEDAADNVHHERASIDLPWVARERWTKRYGQGVGRVEIACHGDETRAFLAKCSEAGGETFKRCMDHLETIARNGTYKWTDIGILSLSKDWDGFYFRILRPGDQRCTMNGGVVNHGRDGEHSWSTHT